MKCFPSLYPDELVYSWLSRYQTRVGDVNFSQIQRNCFGKATRKQYYLGLPTNLLTLLGRLPDGFQIEVNQLLMEHTLFPYYRTFLTYREIKQLQELMEGTKGKSLAVVARIPESQLYNPKYLKFCPQCVAEDIKQYGETYWHRLHQVPGMGVCLTHRVRLQESSVLVANLGKAFVAADEENCVDDGKNYNEGIVQGVWEFGKKIERKMAQESRFSGLSRLREQYAKVLQGRGFLDDEAKFEGAMVEYYGEDVLRVIHPELMEGLGTYGLSWTMGCDLLWEVDRVVHWLVRGILWD
ncbi:MAG: TniQ family protein [Microcystaceae cyanobacterium]